MKFFFKSFHSAPEATAASVEKQNRLASTTRWLESEVRLIYVIASVESSTETRLVASGRVFA